MPVLPQEDETHGNLTDKVAKESDNSTASTHQHHQTDHQTEPATNPHKANPGPVIAENIGKPAPKEELKARAEELNK